MLPKTLLSLHSASPYDVYSVLNRSVYIDEFQKNDNTILFHTGFRFLNHKRTRFDVYYDLESNSIIRQTVSPYSRKAPQLIGFLCGIGDNKKVEIPYSWLVIAIQMDELQSKSDENILNGLPGADIDDLESLVTDASPVKEVILIGTDGQRRIHKSFQIIETTSNIISLPLQKTFGEIVFQDGSHFSKYQPEHYHRYDYEDYDENDSDSHWICDACGGDASTGCMSSTGECYNY